MSEPFIGEIRIFGFNFAPRGWAVCDGQLLPIAQNTALFSLLGTIYGGDGRTTFALPDLRGRAALHQGNGAGLSNRPIGQRSGSEFNTLTVGQLPSHTHQVRAFGGPGNANTAPGNVWSNDAGNQSATYNSGAANAGMGSSALGNTGGNQSVNNMQPFLVVNYCIALTGLFPSRG